MRHNDRKKDLILYPIPEILIRASTLENLVLKRHKDGIKDTIYKGKYQYQGKSYYSVRALLANIYFNKCAYCEGIENKPEVEHYRPKKGVTEDSGHGGYYWLCYEWTNLLPACRYCNTEGGKGNQFPIQGLRVKFPSMKYNVLDKTANIAQNSPLIDEQPYLLHPEIDFPDNKRYFKFKNTGEIVGIDSLGRGAATIRICNLNRANLLSR